MEERFLQEWSEALTELREKRAKDLEARQEQKTDFSPADFYEIAAASLDGVLERWLSYEKQSANPDLETLRAELDSVFEFELEALNRDLAAVRSSTHWDEDQFASASTSFQSTAELLKQKYALKISGAAPAPAAAPVSAAPAGKAPAKTAPAAPRKEKAAPVKMGGGSSGGSGAGMAMMFFVGLILGGAPSLYFWDLAKKQGARTEEEKTKLAADKRALEDSMTLLRGRFDQLASGELKSLPEIERTIEKIRREADEKKKIVEADYATERDRVLRKVPAGDRHDKLLAENDERRNAALSEIEAAAAQAVEPFEKQKAALQELRAK